MICNFDIRQAAKTEKVRLWQLAKELGISDSTLSRKLRIELPQNEKARIFEIIQKLSEKE